MQSPPGGNQGGNGSHGSGGWPPSSSPWGPPAASNQQPAFPPPQAQPPSSPFRPSPNDPYQAYGQIHASPAAGITRPPGNTGVMKNPRLTGGVLLGLGAFLAGLNYWMLESEGRYYVKAMLLMPFAVLYGLFLLGFGQPLDPATGKPKMWWRIGSGLSLAAGLGLGGLAISYVGC